ncbi:MAG: hypothetical protein IPJ65_07585 [Archangiaceae bacterium]|nr:hypothetical protein [Archangiaceae bacterium]
MSRLVLLVVSLAPLAARADYMDHFVVREDVGVHKAPYLGNAEVLLMPVEVAGFPPLDLDRLYAFFAADNPQGFVKFMETASLGRYHPHVNIGPVIRYTGCPLDTTKFPGCVVARGDFAAFAAGINLIREVVRRTNEEAVGFDFGALDVNGRRGTPDGWVDGVMLLTNMPFGGIAFPVGYFNRGDNLAGATGGPLIVDGVKVGHVAIAGDGDLYTMVHEFSHLLGLTDLYAENRTYPGLQLSVMGAWGYDPNIPLHDAESRFRLRWGNWHQVQGKQKVVIAPAEGTGEVWRLGTGDEYFLVENRGPGQFDRSFTTRGLAVYHVDRRVKLAGEEGRFQDRILDCVNCDAFHPYIMNVQADEKFELQQPQAKFSYEDDLFRDGAFLGADPSGVPLSADHPVASTNWYSGQPSGIEIGQIRVSDDGAITATLIAPSEGQCGEKLCDEGEACAPLTCESPGESSAGCQCGAGQGPLVLGALLLLLLEQRLRRRQQRVFRA